MADSGPFGPNRYQFDDLSIDSGKRLVLRDTAALEISGLTYDLLLAIVQAAPNIISADELVEKVWSGRPTSPETITQRAMMLRQGLGDNAESPRYIEVVRGQGFRLIPEIVADAPAESTPPPKPRSNYAIPLALAAIVIAGIFVLKEFMGTSVQDPLSTSGPVRRFAMELGALDRLGVGSGSIRTEVAISPDGSRLVYVASSTGYAVDSTQLYIRELDRLDAQVISGTETARRPFFSPDGEWIGFDSEAGTKIDKISIRGGSKKMLAEGHQLMYGGSWSEQGVIVFSTMDGASRDSGKLVIVGDEGGNAEDLLVSDGDQAYTWPHFLPGGDHLLFTSRALGNPSTDGSISVLSLDSGQHRTLVAGAYNAKYSPTGHIIFTRGDTLWAVPFDLESLQINGTESPLFSGLEHNARIGDSVYDFSDGGLLVYLLGDEASRASIDTLVPVWVDREGNEEPIDVPPADYVLPRISPDGTRAVVMVGDGLGFSLWIIDLERETRTPLTFGDSVNLTPHWSPDGEKIYYYTPGSRIFSKAADGTGSPTLINQNDIASTIMAISPDGKHFVVADRLNNESDLYVFSADGEAFPQPLVVTEHDEDRADISPDGGLIAYESNESGRNEIYVRTFPNPEGGRWRVSTAGGVDPRWNPNGRELFFRGEQSNTIFAADVITEPSFSSGEPRMVAAGQNTPGGNDYAVSADGERFLQFRRVGSELDSDESGTKDARLAIVENWFEELKKITPTD
jgi:Tol biopolymer transport system component/DNA-binding winged helix-turn-helix (wHTH) protein